MRQRERRFERRYAVILVVLVAGLAGLPGSAHARGLDQCVTADVSSPMLLPDGSLHPAGSIRICLDRDLTPATGLHRTYVDGMPVGVFMSDVERSEGPPTEARPVLQFSHANSGAWILNGYAIPDGHRTVTYGMNAARTERRAADAPVATEPAILIAAR